MEKSGEETEKTIQDAVQSASDAIRINMQSLKISSKCSIYKVPDYVRKGKEECYRPLAMSIGPMHYGNPELEIMQKHKLIVLQWFLEHPNSGGHNLEYYLDYIRRKEEQIYECYQECKKIPSERFIEMILLDAVIIICFFIFLGMKFYIPKEIIVLLPHNMWRDIFLLENQLPYFILNGLYGISFGTTSDVPFIELTRNCMGEISQATLPGSRVLKSNNEIRDASEIAHLLHFLCYCLHLDPPQDEDQQRPLTKSGQIVNYFLSFVPSKLKPTPSEKKNWPVLPLPAKKLRDAGIKFKATETENQLHIRYADGVLEIPKIQLDDTTETAIRNIQYFEQCHYLFQPKQRCCFIDYIYFLDSLINTSEDIQILLENNILYSYVGTHQEAADVFNKATFGISLNVDFGYEYIFREMNAYANARWNRWKTTLRRDYLNSPWSIISVGYAILLFILNYT